MKVFRLRKGPPGFREYADRIGYHSSKSLMAESGVSDMKQCGNYFLVEGETDAEMEQMGWLFKDTIGTYDVLTGWNVREVEFLRRKKDSAVFIRAETV